MPDPYSIPFKQAAGNGHYESKQLPNDNADFLVVLGLPTSIGNVTSASPSSLDGQLAAYWGTSGNVIKASTLIGIVDLVDGKVTTKPTPTGDIVGTLAIQTLTNKTLNNPAFTGTATGLTKASVGLGNVDNTSDVAKPVSTAQQTALNLKEDKSQKGVANGYAGLDATAKVPTSQLPAAVLGATIYQGTWNALSNNPVIPAASAANKGWYYVVSVAGSTMVDGNNEWAIRDWIVSNGTTWDKIDNTDAVTSVAGRMGAVVLTKADVGLDQVDNTSDATKNAAAVVLTNKIINGNNNTLVVRLNADVVGDLPIGNLDGGAGASSGSFWRGDGHWGTPAGGGDVAGPGGSVDGELALYNGVSGTILKRSSGTGIANVINGVYQTPIPVANLTPRLPRNYLAGLILSNNTLDATNDLDVGAGSARDDTDAADITLSAITKRLDATWVAGTNQGGRDTGAIADVTWHVFAIRNPSTLVTDVLFSQNIATPLMPSGFTQKRRIGSIIRRAGTIVAFVQLGDYFQIAAPILDVPATATNTAGVTHTLQNCPVGKKFRVDMTIRGSGNSATANLGLFVRDPDQIEDPNPNLFWAALSTSVSSRQQIWVNASAQVISRLSGAGPANFLCSVNGYFDSRGKDE
jgi:hypothetical protein